MHSHSHTLTDTKKVSVFDISQYVKQQKKMRRRQQQQHQQRIKNLNGDSHCLSQMQFLRLLFRTKRKHVERGKIKVQSE